MTTPLLPGGTNAAGEKQASTIVWSRRLLAVLVVLMVLYQLQGYAFLRRDQEQEVDEARREAIKDLLPQTHNPPFHQPSDSTQQQQQQQQQQQHSESPRLPRIFDIIMLNNEMDQLEIRMGELHGVVDVFVIAESVKTFSRKDKPLFYRQHQHEERFAKYRNKILHIVVPDMTDTESQRMSRIGGGGWEYETFVRNKAVEMLIDTFRPSEGDWLLLSDLDEIPKPAVLAKLKQDPASLGDKILGPRNWQRHTAPFMQRHTGLAYLRLDCDFYYYSYEYKHRGQWTGPVLARYEDPEPGVDPFADNQNNFDKDGMLIMEKPFWHDYANLGYRMRFFLRHDADVQWVPQSCWHCSWCFANITDVKRKANSYSHQEHANSIYMEQDWILKHFREGVDLFDRGGEIYDYIKDNKDVPSYVSSNLDKFSYQLHRKDRYNAGFKDVPEQPPQATPANKVGEPADTETNPKAA